MVYSCRLANLLLTMQFPGNLQINHVGYVPLSCIALFRKPHGVVAPSLFSMRTTSCINTLLAVLAGSCSSCRLYLLGLIVQVINYCFEPRDFEPMNLLLTFYRKIESYIGVWVTLR